MNLKDIRIRNMLPEDCVIVAEIHQKCFVQGWSVKMFEDSLKFPTYHYVVAERMEDLSIIGFAGISASVDTADVMDIGVLPEYRQQGIGGLLFHKLEELTIITNCSCLMLEVRESNIPAIRLYHKYGLQQIAVRNNYYSNPVENAIIMQKNYSYENRNPDMDS